MDTFQLNKILSNDCFVKKYFMGVFAADEIPLNILTTPCILLSNTDVSSQSGSHWVCIYVDSEMEGYFFDSLGRSPKYYKHNIFQKFLDTNCKSWTYNKIQLQSFYSSVCGFYCIAFAYYICRGQSITKFLLYFTKNRFVNDLHITSFVKERLNIL